MYYIKVKGSGKYLGSETKLHSLSPEYQDELLYRRKGSNFIGRNDTYDGVKLTPTRYKLIPGAYADKYNHDTYKILNNGVDDRSKLVRNKGKIFGGLSTLGGAVAGTGLGLMSVAAAPVVAPALVLGGAGLALSGGIAYNRNRNRRNKELQMKMIDAAERAKTKKHSFQKDNPYYKRRGFLREDEYKGHKLTHGLLQNLPILGENVYQDTKYRDNIKYLTGNKPTNIGRSISTTAFGAPGNALSLAGGGIVGLPLQAIALANNNRQDREVQIEAIKLANKLKGKRQDDFYHKN